MSSRRTNRRTGRADQGRAARAAPQPERRSARFVAPELRTLRRLLADPVVRLVTLTGPAASARRGLRCRRPPSASTITWPACALSG